MEKNLKNKVWNLLPTEFKEEVINRYNQNIGNVYNFESMVEASMLENLFGSENLIFNTNDAQKKLDEKKKHDAEVKACAEKEAELISKFYALPKFNDDLKEVDYDMYNPVIFCKDGKWHGAWQSVYDAKIILEFVNESLEELVKEATNYCKVHKIIGEKYNINKVIHADCKYRKKLNIFSLWLRGGHECHHPIKVKEFGGPGLCMFNKKGCSECCRYYAEKH